MDLSLFRQKDIFPSYIEKKLSTADVDYKEKYNQIKYCSRRATPHLAAGVILLLNYRQVGSQEPEYVFQLIKRSDKVSQPGDISCPGGMFQPRIDKIFSYILTRGLFPSLSGQISRLTNRKDKETVDLIRLFLATAARETWEEIGLNPFRISFLGALPCYSLFLISRTIFPLVCLVPGPFHFRLSAEVEKIIEIPVRTFFESSRHAFLEIDARFANTFHINNTRFPCLVIDDDAGQQEILWGATYYIIINFLRIISDDTLPVPSSPVVINKVLSENYISGRTDRSTT